MFIGAMFAVAVLVVLLAEHFGIELVEPDDDEPKV